MFKKATIALIAVMSCFALIGVGFSSWAMGAGNKAEQNVKLSSEDIIVSDEYVKIDEKRMEELNKNTFVVSPQGFISTENDTISIGTKGTLQIPLTVDMGNCYKLSQTALQVNITVSLETASDLLTATDFISPTCSDKSITQLQGNGLSSTKEYLISFSLVTVASNEKKEFIIDLNFNFKDLSSYTNLYKALQVVQDDESTKKTITNPFSFVVAVSNG